MAFPLVSREYCTYLVRMVSFLMITCDPNSTDVSEASSMTTARCWALYQKQIEFGPITFCIVSCVKISLQEISVDKIGTVPLVRCSPPISTSLSNDRSNCA